MRKLLGMRGPVDVRDREMGYTSCTTTRGVNNPTRGQHFVVEIRNKVCMGVLSGKRKPLALARNGLR